MTQHCPHCGFDLSAPALSRVTLHPASWGGSPAPYLSGHHSDLESLVTQGYAVKTASGWYTPSPSFPG